MAHHQALFDALAAGMDSQATALAVQSLLEAQPVQESTTTADDDDVFQCGKCKKQFTSLSMFMNHKREHCAAQNTVTRPLPVSVVPSNNSAFTSALSQSGLGRNVSYGTVPPSPLTQVTSNVVLGEEVLISPFSSVEQNLQLQTSVLQASGPFLSSQPNQSRLLTSVTTTQHHHQQQQHHHHHQPQHHQQQQQQSFCTSNITPGTITLHQATGPPPQVLINSSRPSPIAAATVTITDSTLSQVTQEILGVASRHSPSRQDVQTRGVNILPVPPGGLGRRRSGDSTSNKKQGKLKCNYCDRAFNKPFDLAQHVRSHTGEKPFQCIVCGRAFAQKSNVKKHMATHKVWPSGKGPTLPDKPITKVTPDLAANQTDNGEEVLQELEKHRTALPVTEVHSIGLESMDDGVEQIMIDSSYVCQYCGEKYNSYFQLKTHMTSHKNEQVYKCIMKTCTDTFKDLDSYLEHTKAHESEMMYRCHLCSKQFPSLYELGVHQYSHSLYPSQGPHQKQRTFRCQECKSKYATEEALEHHLATTDHHFACTHCKKVFPCERYLRRHLPTHSSQGNYECSICHKRFKTDTYLKSHHLIHTGDKPFKCTTCGAEFNRKDKLKRHNLIHDPVKRHKCPFKMLTGCTKEFNRPDKLKAHIVSHSGIKPFKCTECNKCFSRRPNLNEHMRAHKDDYDIRCEICNKGFGRKKHLEQHKLRAHKAGIDNENATVEVSLLDGGQLMEAPKKKRKSKPVRYDEGDDDSMPIVKTKTRQVKMLHSGFGKGKKIKKERKSTNVRKVTPTKGTVTETDLSEIQKDLEIIRSGLQKQKEEQERLEHERDSGSSEPGREKITGSTDPMPIQGTDQTTADGLNVEGQFGNLGGDDGVTGNDDGTIVFQLKASNQTVC